MDGTTVGPLVVRAATEADEGRWDAFVESSPEASFFHLFGWRTVIEGAFGHRTHFLCAERGGELAGVLPLVHIRSRLFSNLLVSNAFCVGGGPAASDPATALALLDRAAALARSLGVDVLELRSPLPAGADAPDGWRTRSDLYVSFRKPIKADPEKNLLAIPRKQRAMVRKGIKLGLAGTVDDRVDDLYEVYAESVRNLGTPVFGKGFLRRLKAVFKDRCDVITIRHPATGPGVIAGVMNFYFRDTVLPYYGGARFAARDLAANDFMYWEVMRRAAERGYAWFDFGRSKADTGAYHFKRHWGFEPEPLTYSFYLNRAKDIPNINPLNPKYRLFIAAWRRLPLWLAKRIGPPIARDLG